MPDNKVVPLHRGVREIPLYRMARAMGDEDMLQGLPPLGAQEAAPAPPPPPDVLQGCDPYDLLGQREEHFQRYGLFDLFCDALADFVANVAEHPNSHAACIAFGALAVIVPAIICAAFGL